MSNLFIKQVLILIRNEKKSHYVYIKDFHRFMYHKTNHKDKNNFFMNCLQCCIKAGILTNDKKFCFKISDKQGVHIPEKVSIA